MSKTTTRTPFEALEFPAAQLDPSPFQARKRFDERGLEELAASVREHGIIQPLVVRDARPGSGRLEIVAGERRWRASRLAGLEVVPVIVRELNDTAAEELMLIENLQREDLTHSEEAHGLERMLALRSASGAPLYTVATLAAKIGKDEEYVTARLKLLQCPAALIAAVDEGVVKVSTAMLVGRVPDAKARAECAKRVLTPETQEVPLNYAQTKEMIREEFMVKLSKSDFDFEDAGLLPVRRDDAGERCLGGACADCPFRSGNLDGEGGPRSDVRKSGGEAWLCTLPKCHRLKLDAAWTRKRDAAAKAGVKTVAPKEAEAIFSGHNGGIKYDAKVAVVTSGETYVDGVGWVDVKAAVKAAGIKPMLAQHPETGKVVELVSKDEIKVAAAAAKEQKPVDEVAAKQAIEAEEAKARRAKEIRQGKIDALALDEGVREIREGIGASRVKADERLFAAMFTVALDHAGSDGIRFLAELSGIERDKKAGTWGLQKPLQAWAREQCETAPQWLALTVVAMLAKSVHFMGLKDEHFQTLLALCGLKVADLERRAKALIDGQGKAAKEAKAAPAAPVKNSVDPVVVSTEAEASKTAAADGRAKRGMTKPEGGMTNEPESTGFVRKVQDYRCDACDCQISVPFGKGDEAARLPKGEMNCVKCGGKWQPLPIAGIAPAKLGKATGWTPDDIAEGAARLKDETATITELIGPKPDRKKDAIGYKTWNGLRMKLLRWAGLAK